MYELKKAYVITLKNSDDKDLCDLKKKLEVADLQVEFVEGVRGSIMSASAYFEHAIVTLSKYGYSLSPGEIGCALGHLGAYIKIAQSSDEFSLIFEDDAIVDRFVDSKLQLENYIACKSPKLIHIGRLDHLKIGLKLRGRPSTEFEDIYDISGSDLENLFGTFAYGISKSTATTLVSALRESIFLIDDFVKIADLLNVDSIPFLGIVSHPRGYEKSAIQGERDIKISLRKTNLSLIRRLLREISVTTLHRFNRFKLMLRKLKGETVYIYTDQL